jgi:hypothetical protein
MGEGSGSCGENGAEWLDQGAGGRLDGKLPPAGRRVIGSGWLEPQLERPTRLESQISMKQSSDCMIYNLRTGTGYSVLDAVGAFEKLSDRTSHLVLQIEYRFLTSIPDGSLAFQY